MRPLTRQELYAAPGAHVVLRGSFQRYELYSEEAERIRLDWLNVLESPPERASSDFVISLVPGALPHVTAAPEMAQTEFLAVPHASAEATLTDDEVCRLARTVSHTRLYIITADPVAARQRLSRELRAEWVILGPETFRFIRSFQKIAISQNALHWWAAFLSDAKEIYFPPCNRGHWSHPESACLYHQPEHYGIDLRIQTARYIYDW